MDDRLRSRLIVELVRAVFRPTDPNARAQIDEKGRITVSWTSPSGKGVPRVFEVVIHRHDAHDTCYLLRLDSHTNASEPIVSLVLTHVHTADTWSLFVENFYDHCPRGKDDPTLAELTPLFTTPTRTRLFDASRRFRNQVASTPLHLVVGSVGMYAGIVGNDGYEPDIVHIARIADTLGNKTQMPVLSDEYSKAKLLNDLKQRFGAIREYGVRHGIITNTAHARLKQVDKAGSVEDMAQALGHYGERTSKHREMKVATESSRVPILMRVQVRNMDTPSLRTRAKRKHSSE